MIDWTRLHELQEEVGVDDFQEVVALFLEEADEAVERLSPALPADVLENDFHALKGSALNLGFSDLAQICARAEKSAAAGDIGAIEFAAASQTYAASKAALSQKIGNADAA